MQQDTSVASREAIREAWAPARELRQSFFLIAFLLTSIGAYLGIGMLAVKVLA